MSNEKLSQLFGVENMRETLPEVKEENTDLDKDVEDAKNNIKILIETGNRALEEALNLAMDSEDPKTYDMFTNMIVALAELNQKVIDTHNQKQTIKNKAGLRNKSDQQVPTNQTVNNQNIVFQGSAAELSDFLKTLNNPTNDGNIIDV